LRFDEGYSSYLEVTYSQNLLYNAELIRTAVQRSPLQAFANLYQAMGAQASEFSRRSRTFLASAGVAKLTIKTNTKNAVDLNIESSERVALRLILWNVWYGHRL
jgi:hypothetical protein